MLLLHHFALLAGLPFGAAFQGVSPDVSDAQPIFEGGGYVIVSSLAILPGGDVMCICFAQRPHAAALGVTTDASSLVIGRISGDGGKTWGSAFAVMATPPGHHAVGDATIVVSGDRVHVVATAMQHPTPPFTGFELWATTSTDRGKTWTTPRLLDTGHKCVAVSGRSPLVLASGRILLPYYWDYKAEHDQAASDEGAMVSISGVLISDDGGDTWRPGADIVGPTPEGATQPLTCDEPAIVELPDGRVYLLARNTHQGRTFESTSTTQGDSWAPLRQSPLHSFNTPSCLLRRGDDSIVCAWDDNGGARDWRTSRYPLVVATSRDAGGTWSEPQTIATCPPGSVFPTQCSYPSLVEVADGALLASWCHVTPEGRWLLMTGRITLP